MNSNFFAKIKALLFTISLLISLSSLLSANELEKDLSSIIQSAGVSPEHSTLVIVRLEDNSEWISGKSRSEKAYVTGCTINIPITLIALQTGYAEGPDTLFEWDGKQRWLASWNQDQTFRSAFQRSAVWVFQKISQDLGYETISEWINQIEYGNQNIGTPENYWLMKTIETSARDQVLFLSKLALEMLPFSPEIFRLNKQIMQEDKGPHWTLYSKTGWRPDVKIGWYVGWLQVEKQNQKQTYVFAFNMDITDMSELPLRQSVVRLVFNRLGLIFE